MTLAEFMVVYRDQGSLYTTMLIDTIQDCDLITFICECPELSKHFQGTRGEWRHLLKHNPQYAMYCDWSIFTGMDWWILLQHQSQFHINCDWKPKLIPDHGWLQLLCCHPTIFEQYCDWSIFNAYDWTILLRRHREFIVHCPSHVFARVK